MINAISYGLILCFVPKSFSKLLIVQYVFPVPVPAAMRFSLPLTISFTSMMSEMNAMCVRFNLPFLHCIWFSPLACHMIYDNRMNSIVVG